MNIDIKQTFQCKGVILLISLFSLFLSFILFFNLEKNNGEKENI